MPRRITWILWVVFEDGSRSLADILDWEPGYNSTAREAWVYAWGAFRATMRDPSALGGVSFAVAVEGR